MGVAYRFLPYEPMKETVALFLSEFLYHALKNEDRNMPLFQYLKSGLLWFDEARSGTANFHLVFTTRLCHLIGFHVDNQAYRQGMQFDISEGVFTALPIYHPYYLTAE